jgi:predicted outer membrane repeat protein
MLLASWWALTAVATVHVPAGNVSGTWYKAQGPYIVDGDIALATGSTLTIQAGVDVVFSGHYNFVVNGRLLAIGNVTDSIRFYAQTPATGWAGLRFMGQTSNGQDSSKVVYCALRHGKANGANPYYNGGAIYCSSSNDVLVKHCRITNNSSTNTGGAIYCSNSSIRLVRVLMAYNTTSLYGGGLYLSGTSNISASNVTLGNNTAGSSGGGIYVAATPLPVFTSCIFWDDAPAEIYEASAGNSTVTYSDVEGGFAGTGNFNINPLFVNAAGLNYNLTPCSPCVDTGNPAVTDPDGTRTDMGAYYFNKNIGSIVYGGLVSGPWTLLKSPFYVCGAITVPSTLELSIEAGVEVIFYGHYKLIVNGRLIVSGTTADSVHFTAANTTEGWHGIRFINTNNNALDSSILSCCDIRYGKATGTSPDNCGGGLYFENSRNIRVSHSTIRNCEATQGGGLFFSAGSDPLITGCAVKQNPSQGLCSNSCAPVIAGNVITGNTYGLYAINSNPPFPTVQNNSFTGNNYPVYVTPNAVRHFTGNTFSGNTYDFYVIAGTVTESAYWEDQGIPYYISGDVSVSHASNPLLELEPGTVLKFTSQSGLYIGNSQPGGLRAIGTENEKILFTGNYAGPSYWDGVYFGYSTDDAQSMMAYCIVEYGGYSSNGDITINQSSPVISHCEIAYENGPGIAILDAGNQNINHCWIHDCGNGISCYYSFIPVTGEFVNNTLEGNYSYGISMMNGGEGLSIINNIFYDNYSLVHTSNPAVLSDFHHNLVWNNDTIEWSCLPQGCGNVTMTNSNGDACDPYYNLFMNPKFVNPAGGNFNLLSVSPCINAGDASLPWDADNTNADLGAFYYHQPASAAFTSIKDVPNDQGKQVEVIWDKSFYDEFGGSGPITYYSLWREPSATKENLPVIGDPAKVYEKIKAYAGLQDGLYGGQEAAFCWDQGGKALTFIASVPAMGFDEYSVIAPTLFDSVAGNIPYATFQLFAHSHLPSLYYSAVPDSGYSVDNLAPGVPKNLTGVLLTDHILMTWDKCTDPDLQYYAIYKSDVPGSFPSTPYVITSDTTTTDWILVPGTVYYAATAFDHSGNESPYSNTIYFTITSGISLDVKVYLEGPYEGPLMGTQLNSSGYLPLSQPYNTLPWGYNGTEAVSSIPNADVVDWILVELRDAPTAAQATPAAMIARQAGFLLRDGHIRTTDGSNLLTFNVTITSNLFVVIWHRNHLNVMSATPVPGSGGVYAYDFSSAAGQAYSGSNGHKQIAAGLWGMFGGDGNGNGQINNADKLDVWRPQSGSSGYKTGDFDLNGQVNNIDKVDVWKPNSGAGSQVPS